MATALFQTSQLGTVAPAAQAEETRANTLALSIQCVSLVLTLFGACLAFGAVDPWAWGALAAIATILVFAWALQSVRQKVLRIIWSPLYLPAAFLLLLAAAQFWGHLSFDPIATRESLIKLVTELIFFFLAVQLWATAPENAWRRLGLSVAIFAFALGLFAILQFFSSAGLIYWRVKPRWGGWIFGPYVNHNHFAGLMEMLIPIGVVALLSLPRERPVRPLLAFAVLIPIASVLLSGSRGGTISLLAEVLIMGAVLGRCARRSGRRLALFGTLGLTAALSLFLWMDPGQISERLAGLFRITHSPSRDLSFLERKTVALDTLRILSDHPWAGTGLGSFQVAYPPYQSLPGDLVWVHAHNDYAEVLAETGVPGGFLVVGALAMFFVVAFRNLTERLKSQAGWIQLGAAVGCCGLLVHSLSDFNLHIPANAAWFATCAALATCGRARRLNSLVVHYEN